MNFKEIDQNWADPKAKLFIDLVIALSKNPVSLSTPNLQCVNDVDESACFIIQQATAIMKEIERQNK